ncbi:hypothetical protein NDU88_002514 [Pleurodeles waltl]|uniref:Myb/SANT-like DNA-binding domain-containing protein n=1 Tax=Pleurodeles waltl TaxID=8319 RepID=A0AAV7SEX2_PLEWA|nr:hypothetical protein NDU88_002514 [Pleurodeles waltl]
MAHVSGERDPAFTAEKLEKLVDGVLPQYTLLYGPPDKQVSAHQKKGIWHAITKKVRTLGVFDRWSTHCRKQWEDLRRWARKMAEAQLGAQRGRGACRTLTPLMFRILVVAYPVLDGRLKASEQPQGASSGRGAEALATEGAASHMGLEAESTDGEGTSGTEGARGAPRQRQEGTPQTATPPPMEASWWWRTPLCPPQQQVQTPRPLPAPLSQRPLSVFSMPAHPGGWASPLHQAPQALPQSALLPSVRRLLTS